MKTTYVQTVDLSDRRHPEKSGRYVPLSALLSLLAEIEAMEPEAEKRWHILRMSVRDLMVTE